MFLVVVFGCGCGLAVMVSGSDCVDGGDAFVMLVSLWVGYY